MAERVLGGMHSLHPLGRGYQGLETEWEENDNGQRLRRRKLWRRSI